MDPRILIEQIAPGAQITDHWPLAGGASAAVEAVAFTAVDGSKQRVVIRRHRDMAGKPDPARRAAMEHALLTRLHAQGAPVPRPRLLAPPDTLVLDLVVGDATLPRAAAEPLAAALAAIHAVDPPPDVDLPLRVDPLPELKIWSASGDATRAGELDAVASRCGPFRGTPRLLHGDYWPGNVLWHEGRLSAVLDWEDAARGDPLSDLACARVELALVLDSTRVEAFTAEYLRLSGVDPHRLPLWDLYVSTAALEYMDLWGLAPGVLAARRAVSTDFQRRAQAVLGLR